MLEISKSDWKLFRERVPGWQEHYMERLTKEYMELLSSPGPASKHFWELEKRISNDKRHPGVILEMKRSQAVWDLVRFIKMEVISTDDLASFSQELIEQVMELVQRF